MKKHVLKGLFGLYCLAAVYLLFFWNRTAYGLPREIYSDSFINFVPFKTMARYMPDSLGALLSNGNSFMNLVGNVLFTVPLGLLLPALFKPMQKLWLMLVVVAAAVCAAEALQFWFMLGSCDIDDLILNLFGALLGFGLWGLRPLRKLLTV